MADSAGDDRPVSRGDVPNPEIAFDIMATWQARILIETHYEPLGAVVLSALAHQFDADCLMFLMREIYPGFQSIAAPFICSTAKVDKAGRIVADVVAKDERVVKNVALFESEIHLRDQFRRLADRLKFTDQERLEMFHVVKHWVASDTRLDPTMDPQDPDAKRLIH